MIIKRRLLVVFAIILSIVMLANLTACSFSPKDQNQGQEEVKYSDMVKAVYDMHGHEVSVVEKGNATLLSARNEDGQTVNHTFVEDEITKVEYSKGGNLQFESIINSYEYNANKKIVKIDNSGKNFNFSYDENGNFISGSLNGATQYVNYYDSSDNLLRTEYANGDKLEYFYDNDDRIVGISLNNVLRHKFVYDGNTITEYNTISGTEIMYKADEYGSINSMVSKNVKFDYEYGNKGISNVSYILDGVNNVVKYNDNSCEYGKSIYNIEKNDLGYINKKTFSNGSNDISIDYLYTSANDIEVLVSDLIFAGNHYQYYYDNNNNLIKICCNGSTLVEYEYDMFGQLVCENNISLDLTIIYTYLEGNMDSKTLYSYSTKEEIEREVYQYDNNDRLLSINGQDVIFDEYGNTLFYNNTSLTWEGTLLTSLSTKDIDTKYTYNYQGIRTEKFVNGERVEYILEDNRVIYEVGNDYLLYFLYDSEGEVIGFVYEGEYYFYLKNAMTDIIGILDESGNLIVEYSYDAYGKLLSMTGEKADTIGKINPYRYKSYRYDNESGLYYLNSRYYDPSIARFISADNIMQYTSNPEVTPYYNLYMYANNNPVKYVDPDGNEAITIAALAKVGVQILIVTAVASVVLFFLAKYHTEIGMLIDRAYNQMVDLFESLKNAIPSLWEKWTKSDKPNIHHIVAQSAWRAEPARAKIMAFGITVNNPINLIALKQRFHQKLHTAAYYSAINVLFSWQKNIKEVLQTYGGIRILLSAVNLVA